MSEKFQPLGPNLLADYFVNERMLIKSTNSLLYGFADKNGRLKIPFKYKIAFPFSEGLASFLDSTTMTFGFIDLKGNIVLKPKYSFINYLRSDFSFEFSEGLCKIYNSSVNYSDINTIPDFNAEYISFINKKGEEVIKLNSEIVEATNFVNGTSQIINIQGKVALINKMGRIVKDFEYID